MASDKPDAWLYGLPPGPFKAILADPPWKFDYSRRKFSPGHRFYNLYPEMELDQIAELGAAVRQVAAKNCHLYLWVPVSMLEDGLFILGAWGFKYKTALFWVKTRQDGQPDGSGLGTYFRNAAEVVLFGTRGSLKPLSIVNKPTNVMQVPKTEHSRKPGEIYHLVEATSPGPRLEMFGRGAARDGWEIWGNEAVKND